MQAGYLALQRELNEISERRSRLMVAHARYHKLSSHLGDVYRTAIALLFSLWPCLLSLSHSRCVD